MKIFPKQWLALQRLQDQKTNELIFGGGAGGGKSILGCYWVLKSALKYPGTRWVIGRASQKTLKETTLNTFFQVCGIQGVKPTIHFKYNENRSIIVFANGSEILLKDLGFYPSDPDFDELGSLEITGAFVDECNQIIEKAWDILKSRIRYKLDMYGLVPKMLGTCNPSKNWVFIKFYSPSVKNELAETKAFIQSLVDDNPEISKHYKNNLLTLPLASKQRLLYGNWEYDDDPTVLCSYDAITDCFTNNVKPGEKAISADLAMQGRDRFVVGIWEGLICKIEIDKERSTGKEIQEDLERIMRSKGVGRSQTVADSDGMGAYLVSYLEGIKEFHGGASPFDKKEYANLKSECAYKLAEVINNRQLKIICSPEQKGRIIEELGVLKADSVDKDESKKRIIKKELMKELINRSPDYLDMLLMRMWFLVRTKPLEIYE